jgi:hypothetical protein
MSDFMHQLLYSLGKRPQAWRLQNWSCCDEKSLVHAGHWTASFSVLQPAAELRCIQLCLFIHWTVMKLILLKKFTWEVRFFHFWYGWTLSSEVIAALITSITKRGKCLYIYNASDTKFICANRTLQRYLFKSFISTLDNYIGRLKGWVPNETCTETVCDLTCIPF